MADNFKRPPPPCVLLEGVANKRPRVRIGHLSQPCPTFEFQGAPHANYFSNTCEVVRLNGETQDTSGESLDNEENLDVQDKSGGLKNAFVNTFTQQEIDDCTQADGGIPVDRDDELKAIRASLDDLRRNSVSKQDFRELSLKFDRLTEIVQNYFGGTTVEEADSQSLLSPGSRSRQSKECASEVLYCCVEDGGCTRQLSLPKSVILRIEASNSKRGIIKEVLRFLHPDRGYFNNKTLTGQSSNSRKQLSSDDILPLSAVSVKLCLAAVNRARPLDVSRFQQGVVAEEQEKYDKNTREEIGRAIIDIRNTDTKEKVFN